MTNEELQQQIDELKLQLNTIKNTPTFKLLWTAAELQEKMCGIIGNEPYVLGEAVKGAIVQEVAEVVPAPSYNDLTDKPFYEETEVKVLFEGTAASELRELPAPFVPEVGKTYTFTSSRGTFSGVCVANGTDLVVQADDGNITYAYMPSGEKWMLSDSTTPAGIDMTVSAEVTTLKTIEPKFIPGAVLPVLTIDNADSREMTAEEAEFMETVLTSKMPFVLIANADISEIVCVMNYSSFYGVPVYAHKIADNSYNQGRVEIYKSGDTWRMFYSVGSQA